MKHMSWSTKSNPDVAGVELEGPDGDGEYRLTIRGESTRHLTHDELSGLAWAVIDHLAGVDDGP
jgi:hypothetical protein